MFTYRTSNDHQNIKQKIYSMDDYKLLRAHMYELAETICFFIENGDFDSVLEIGPSDVNCVEKEFENYNTNIIRKTCDKYNVNYKSVDIVGNPDYKGSAENLSEFVTEKFDVVILLGILEHVKKPYLVPKQLYDILNDHGKCFINVPFLFKIHGPEPDCWRFTPQGLEILFDEYFDLCMSSYPENELKKNSLPLSINVLANRKSIW